MWREIGSSRFFGFCCGIAVLLVSATACVCIVADTWRRSAVSEQVQMREPTAEEFKGICDRIFNQPGTAESIDRALRAGMKCRCLVDPVMGAGISCRRPSPEEAI